MCQLKYIFWGFWVKFTQHIPISRKERQGRLFMTSESPRVLTQLLLILRNKYLGSHVKGSFIPKKIIVVVALGLTEGTAQM